MSEGDPEYWAAVAGDTDGRVRKLGWHQRELAECSHVPLAVMRETQRHAVERRRSPRTLEALSVALGWEPDHLDKVLKGRTPGGHAAAEVAALRSRLDSVELRLAEISKLVTGTQVRHRHGD